MWDVVARKLLQHVCGHFTHFALAGLPTTATAVLGLYAHDGLQHLPDHVALEPIARVEGVESGDGGSKLGNSGLT